MELVDYVVIGPRIEGGFGDIHECRDKISGRRVAIKMLHPTISVRPREVERFRREIDSLRRLRHRHIVDLLAVGVFEGRPYYAMEWLDGITLEDELARRGAIAPADAWPLVAPLCDAVAAAHEVGVVHRDLKPANVMLARDGGDTCVKLIDFGIASLVGPRDAGVGLTSTGTCLGTPAYMAPEQILGDPIDERTDVYALGVLLFRIVTGREPYRSSPAEVAMMHLDAPVPLASARRAEAAAWDLVIARCLAKRPTERWQRVRDLGAALEAALAAAPSEMAAPALSIQLEIASDDWDAIDRALALAEERAAQHGWLVTARADDGLVLAARGELTRTGVIEACERLVRDITDQTPTNARFLIR